MFIRIHQEMPMIRSLVAPKETLINEEFKPNRNLSCPNLEKAFAEGAMMWIDIVDAEADEITWLEQLLNLHPAVVDDLRRTDRRPALMVYPGYLFLSLFQPRIHRNKVEDQEIHCLINGRFFITHCQVYRKKSVINTFYVLRQSG